MPFVQGTVNDQSASATTTVVTLSGQAAGNCNVVAIGNYSGTTTTTISSVADNNSNTYTQIATPQIQGNQGPVYLYAATNIHAGSATITATWSAAVTFTEVVACEYSVATPVVDGVAAVNTVGASASITIGPYTLTTPDTLISYCRASMVLTGVPPGYTFRGGTSTATFGGFADLPNQFPGSPQSVTWNQGSSSIMIGILVGVQQPAASVYVMWGGGF